MVHRFVDLVTGETVAALRLEASPPNPAQHPLSFNAGKSPLALYLAADPTSTSGKLIEALYEPRTGRWDLKLPWRESAGNGCDKFAVDSSPPALFFGCGPVSVLATPGSDEVTLIDGSENFGSGGGNAGLAAWSERLPGLPQRSRVRTWSPDAGANVLVESMPGAACGVAVSAERITGIRSGDPQQATACPGILSLPEFWSASRDGGQVTSWHVPDAGPVVADYGSTWGDYAAVVVLNPDLSLPQAARSSIWVIRLADGKIRRIVPSPAHEWRGGLLAIDATHLFVGENKQGEQSTSVDQIYRYRLDHFDEIGAPLE